MGFQESRDANYRISLEHSLRLSVTLNHKALLEADSTTNALRLIEQDAIQRNTPNYLVTVEYWTH